MNDDIIDDVDQDGYPIQTGDRISYVDEWGYTNSYSPSEEKRRRESGPWFTLVEEDR